MNVLSLYDGMSCGQIAFRELGIPVEEYHAYEIDKYAIKVSEHNFPMMFSHGDVMTEDYTKYLGKVTWLVGGSPCFTRGHLVLTDHGYKDIADIQVGDMVLTHTGEYRRVVRTNSRTAPTRYVSITGHPKLTTTDEHPFYAVKCTKNSEREYRETGTWNHFGEPEWVKAADLDETYFCGQRIDNGKASMLSDITEETAWILGRYLADGHVRKSRRKGRKNSYQYQFILSVGDKKLPDVKDHIKEWHYSCYPHSPSTHRVVISSALLVDLIIRENFGRCASEKRIPEFVFGLPRNVQIAFLNGYLSGDGCEKGNRITATTVSKELAYGMQRLVSNIYHVSCGVCITKNDRPHFIGDREIRSNFDVYNIMFNPEETKLKKYHVSDDIVWTRVKESVPSGKEETVYNIEVEMDNSYTVNNVIVHNCTYWSIAQSPDKRETTSSGIGWELFSHYVRALHEAKPKYFLYENNKSMSKDIRKAITETFGFEPYEINSALVSAQNRQRLYWVGVLQPDGTYKRANIPMPEDRGILLKDVLDDAVAFRDKSYTLDSNYHKTLGQEILTTQAGRRAMAAEPVELSEREMDYMVRDHQDRRWNFANKPGEKDKSECITANVSRGVPYNVCAEPVCVAERGRGSVGEMEQQYEAREDGKTNALTTVSKDNQVSEPIQVGAMPRPNGELSTSQAFRVYDIDAKSVTQNAGGGGAGGKGGLYAVPVCVTDDEKSQTLKAQYEKNSIANFVGYDSTYGATGVAEPVNVTVDGKSCTVRSTCYKDTDRNLVGNDYDRKTCVAYAVEYDDNGKPAKAVGRDGKTYTVYEVADGQITVKEKRYPIKLRDGYYIIRKLTVSECKRLQTVPDWYDMSVISNSQAYKCLGNGWTCSLICWLIDNAMKNGAEETITQGRLF